MQLQGTEILIGVITINASTTWEELASVVQTSFKVPFDCYWSVLSDTGEIYYFKTVLWGNGTELLHVSLWLQDYLVQLDPSTSLGLGGDSIYCLHIGDVVYSPGMCRLSLLREVHLIWGP